MLKIDLAGTKYKLSIVRSKVNSEVINGMRPFGTFLILPGVSLGLLRFQPHARNNYAQFTLVAPSAGRERFIKLEIDTQPISCQ